MSFQMPLDPRTERRTRMTRWVSFVLALALILLVGYFAYLGWEGSRQLASAPTNSADCRTPATMGWSYEAINYEIASDAALAEQPDQESCASQGEPAGAAVTGPGGVGLAGWWIPAESGIGPAGPTVVLAHGWSSNKSDMLDRAAILHPDYNLVLFDFRNHGQSQPADTTQGVREAGDLRVMLDWLEENKAPDRVVALGISMGGVSALNAAARDERIDAVIIESTHATLANAVQARLEASGYPMSIPGNWAVLLGALLRTGVDMSSADPLQAITNLDGRPVLIISGGEDRSIGPNDAEDLLAEAEEAGLPVSLEVCAAAAHAESPEACAEDYAAWVLGFLSEVAPPGG
jgi:pimeloyl-ACP methyl ester carboxylesterase